MFNFLQTPITVVAFDAGAANHIISWVKEFGHESIRVCVKGPALTLWEQAFPHENNNEDLNMVLADAGTLISGTGWASSLEHDARKVAQQLGIKSIAVIDHWTNYGARFVRDEVEVLPDEVWVTDEYAKKLSEIEFPCIKIVQKPNLYLDGLVKDVRFYERSVGNSAGGNLLYVLEPIRESWGSDVINGEFLGLNFFINKIETFGLKKDVVVRLRPHPSDPVFKYDGWINSHKSMNITLDRLPTLAESIAWSDVVVGCQTYAMVLALAAGKRVFSSIPTWAPQCVLPQSGIVRLSSL